MGPSRPVPFLDVGGYPSNLTTLDRPDNNVTADAARTQLDVIVVVLVLLVTILVVMVVCKLVQNKRNIGIFSGRKDNYFSEEHNHRMLILYSSVKLDHGYHGRTNAIVQHEVLP
ncbi:hypothetical protein LSAT2_006469 [Lamellibrachia satsuma]|nr:hypothetical protein LSAT2_006469 [Lamellibrachia satsuma]